MTPDLQVWGVGPTFYGISNDPSRSGSVRVRVQQSMSQPVFAAIRTNSRNLGLIRKDS